MYRENKSTYKDYQDQLDDLRQIRDNGYKNADFEKPRNVKNLNGVSPIYKKLVDLKIKYLEDYLKSINES